MNNSQLKNLIMQSLEYFFQAEDLKARGFLPASDLISDPNFAFPSYNSGSTETLVSFFDFYLKNSVNTSNKLFANQLWSKVENESLAGEFLSLVTNTSMYTYEVAPVATILEHKMIQHLNNLVWSKSGDGTMTSGGTASNLQALMTARHIHFPDLKTYGYGEHQPAIITSEASHYSVKRAANILGLGTENCFEVPTNDLGQMTAPSVQKMIDFVKKRNKKPFCIVATAGTTVYGAFDPIKEIAEICQKENIWLHVDGAYGANALLSQKHKMLLEGLEHADSLSWDFHKAMGLHLSCAFLLTQHKNVLNNALKAGNDEYLFHEDQQDFSDLGQISLQCGRRVDILKLWVTWLSRGQIGMEKRVDQLFESAQHLSQLIKKLPQLQLLVEPQSTNVCFRYIGKTKPVNVRLEAEIRNLLMLKGMGYINYSCDKNGPFFRMAITRPDLTEKDLSKTLMEIIKIGDQLYAESKS